MSTSNPLLLIHISGAVIGLLSGFLAMFLRKGSGLHAAAGSVFFVSMLSMSSTAAVIAAFLKPNGANFVVGVLTFYLVATAWVSAKRRDGGTGLFDRIALLVILANGLLAVVWGFQAAGSPKGLKDGMPAFLYFMFGFFALLCAALDVRMLRRGGFTGPKRILRHLCRMSFALLITVVSFYPGNAKFLPEAVKATNVLYVPHLLLIGALIFWSVRMKRAQRRARSITLEVMAPRGVGDVDCAA